MGARRRETIYSAVVDSLEQLAAVLATKRPVTNDDPRLVELARREGVAALVADLEGCPDALRVALAAEAKSTVFQAMRLDQLTREVGGLLVDVEAVAVKGPVVAHRAWPDPSLRPAVDLDVLVAERDLEEARDALRLAGFEDRPDLGDHGYERMFVRAPHDGRPAASLDLHTAFAPPHRHRIHYGRLLGRRKPFLELAGYRLDDTDQLLHVCLHLANARFTAPLKHLLDVHFWVTNRPVAWSEAIERAEAWGIAGGVGLVLSRASAVFGTVVPDDVRRRLVPSGLRGRWLGFWLGSSPRRRTRKGLALLADRVLGTLPMMDSHADRSRLVRAWTRGLVDR